MCVSFVTAAVPFNHSCVQWFVRSLVQLVFWLLPCLTMNSNMCSVSLTACRNI